MKVRYILLGLIMYLLMGINVDAATSTLAKDEKIGEQTYSLDYVAGYTCLSGIDSSGHTWSFGSANGTLTCSGYYVCGYRTYSTHASKGNYYTLSFYVYNSNGYAATNWYSSYFTLEGTCESGAMKDGAIYECDSQPYKHSDSMYGTPISHYSTIKIYDCLSWVRCNTSIPIFDSQAQAIAFMTGDGTVTEKDAVNYESDIAKVVYDLEVPLKLHTTVIEGDGVNFGLLGFYDELTLPQLLFKWEQSDPNYVNWETEFYCYEDFKYREYILIIGMSPWKNVDNFFLYRDSVECYKLTWNNMMTCTLKGWDKREEQYPTDTQGEYVPLKQTFYIRNAFYDSENGVRHYSNWVKAEYDLSLGELKVSYVELEGSDIEIDSDSGNVSIKDSNVVADSDAGYTGQQNEGVSSQNSSDLLGFINNGFGLLGDNGLISLLSETFSFVPSELWGILLAGISIMVLIAIAKLVF